MTVQNITAVYQLANTAELIEGAAWYPSAKQIASKIGKKYNLPVAVVAGVIAALSPRNKWERNLADAENLIRVFSTDPASIDSLKVCTFGANKAKAVRILQGVQSVEEVLTILSGPKLQEFYSCIMGINNEICIDGHAYSIWLGDRITLANVPSIGIKLRQQIKADYRAAAVQLGIPAAECQAVTWCCWRRLHGVTA